MKTRRLLAALAWALVFNLPLFSQNNNVGNTQLWTLGSRNNLTQDVGFTNRRAAALHLGTNNNTRLTIDAAGDVGIGTTTPQEKLEVAGAIKIEDTTNPNPVAGTIRWNPNTEDFEGYTGNQWKSLTDTGTKFWGKTNIMYSSTENGKLTASSGVSGEGFGVSVSLSGDYAIIGAYGENDFKGSAYIFVRSGNTWTEQANLAASYGGSSYFGHSVSISGDYVVIGAFGDDLSKGAAYVFVRSGNSWIEQARLTASDGAANDEFGWSVSISGDYALIGSRNNDFNKGAAYVFVRSGNNWKEQAKFTASDGVGLHYFSVGVSLSGDYALIGARDSAYFFE